MKKNEAKARILKLRELINAYQLINENIMQGNDQGERDINE